MNSQQDQHNFWIWLPLLACYLITKPAQERVMQDLTGDQLRLCDGSLELAQREVSRGGRREKAAEESGPI
jgi:hypothetical protein